METDVLVVGGGPAGLSAAIELGLRGVNVVLVERSERGGNAPRAKTTNIRSRIHLRRWGIAGRLAEASPLGVTYPNDIKFVTRLAGYPLATFVDAFYAAPRRYDAFPEHAQWIPQYTLEKVLKTFATTLPNVELRFGAAFVTARQDEGGVTSEVQFETGDCGLVRSRYLIGADGARSAVRELIGAKMEGRYGLSRNYNIVFRAPGLSAAHGHGPAVMYWQVNSDGASILGPMDRDDVWFFMPTGMKPGETLSNDAAAAAIAKTTGIEIPYEILSTDEWTASELIADRYRDGRIFLIGDACHLHPPFGGYGMNMGIGDGVDLGWKMAAVLKGWGGTRLLDAYEAERRPFHQAVVEEAVANHAVLGNQLYRDGLEDGTVEGAALREEVGARVLEAKDREFHSLGVVLGLCYRGSPIIIPEVGEPPPAGMTYQPSAVPGCLAPHAWLSESVSLYDEFGSGFTLLADHRAPEDLFQRATEDADALGAPLKLLQPRNLDVRELYGASLALIRPDLHVAWRGSAWNSKVLELAIGRTAREGLTQ